MIGLVRRRCALCKEWASDLDESNKTPPGEFPQGWDLVFFIGIGAVPESSITVTPVWAWRKRHHRCKRHRAEAESFLMLTYGLQSLRENRDNPVLTQTLKAVPFNCGTLDSAITPH